MLVDILGNFDRLWLVTCILMILLHLELVLDLIYVQTFMLSSPLDYFLSRNPFISYPIWLQQLVMSWPTCTLLHVAMFCVYTTNWYYATNKLFWWFLWNRVCKKVYLLYDRLKIFQFILPLASYFLSCRIPIPTVTLTMSPSSFSSYFLWNLQHMSNM